MARIVAFFNQKGGTAKTTSTLNVAAALAERGRRILAIDLDPQASLTMAIGVDVTQLSVSAYDLLLDENLNIADVAVGTTIPGVDLVPSHPDLAAAELELLNVLERERQLDYRLRGADLTGYDYVLIDSPPALNILSINILVAAGRAGHSDRAPSAFLNGAAAPVRNAESGPPAQSRVACPRISCPRRCTTPLAWRPT